MQSKLPADKKWQNNTFLSALKTGVASGELVQNKASYKLSADFKKKISKPAPAPKKKPVAKKAAEGSKKKSVASKKKLVKKVTAASEDKPKAVVKKVTKKKTPTEKKAPTEKKEKKVSAEKKTKTAKPAAEKKKVRPFSLVCSFVCLFVRISNPLTSLVALTQVEPKKKAATVKKAAAPKKVCYCENRRVCNSVLSFSQAISN